MKPIIQLCINDVLLPLSDTAEVFNDHFLTVGPNLANKITLNNDNYLSKFKTVNSVNMAEWELVNYEEIQLLIEGIDVGKNSNINKLQTKYLKECLLCVPDKLMRLFNMVLTTGKFPDKWKIASVVPLHKSGSKTKMQNYRPISLAYFPLLES